MDKARCDSSRRLDLYVVERLTEIPFRRLMGGTSGWDLAVKAIDGWEREFSKRRGAVLRQEGDIPWGIVHGMEKHARIGLIARLKFSFRKKDKDIYRRMCDQYDVDNVVALACCVEDALCKGGSVVYEMLSFSTVQNYAGKVEARPALRRYEEHLRDVKSVRNGTDLDVDRKYEYMARKGQWYMYPVLYSATPIPVPMLNNLEKAEIRRYTNCINKMYKSTVRTGG